MERYINLHAKGCPWYECSEQYGAPNIMWCEETICSWISTPANTWSNLAFILMGVWVLMSWKNSPAKIKVFGGLLIFMGLCSGIYHASLIYPYQILDFVGIFVFLFYGLCLNLEQLGKIQNTLAWTLLLTVLSLIPIHLMYLYHLPFQHLVPLFALGFVYSEYKSKKANYLALKISTLLLLIAVIVRSFDRSALFCDPHNHWVQGHALWHILASFGLYYFAKHFKLNCNFN